MRSRRATNLAWPRICLRDPVSGSCGAGETGSLLKSFHESFGAKRRRRFGGRGQRVYTTYQHFVWEKGDQHRSWAFCYNGYLLMLKTKTAGILIPISLFVAILLTCDNAAGSTVIQPTAEPNSTATVALTVTPIQTVTPAPETAPKVDPAVVNALIAVVGVVIGAVLTAISSAYTARQKIKEIEIVYKQKLQENYLANARQYITDVYIPISIALTRINNKYHSFRLQADLVNN
jgi:hypothetical protein